MHQPSRKASVAERADLGRAARKVRPRRELGDFSPAADRPDPVALLIAQEAVRVPELLPLRHERMSMSPFAFLRGAAAVMAADLGAAPNTGLTVQLCGDAHLSNFGLFAAPDRSLVFDVNDFDETNPGPFEWDVIRLATSFEVAALTAGHTKSFARSLPGVAANAYRGAMTTFATMGDLDIWYYRIDTSLLTAWAQQAKSKTAVKAVRTTERAAMARDRWSAVRSLTTVVDGQRRFKDQPPLLVSLSADADAATVVTSMYQEYLDTLLVDRARLLSRYHWVDAGHKVVGVGSVGLLAFVLLLEGRDKDDLLVLQIKEAVASVLEPFSGASTWPTHGERVVQGQRLIQASADSFLGYVQGGHGRSYYVRQLRDMKWAPDPLGMGEDAYATYAQLCGLALARAHARSGDAVSIAAYVGTSDTFDKAIAEFAHAYTEQNAADYSKFESAIKSGQVAVADDAHTDTRIALKFEGNGVTRVEANPGS